MVAVFVKTVLWVLNNKTALNPLFGPMLIELTTQKSEIGEQGFRLSLWHLSWKITVNHIKQPASYFTARRPVKVFRCEQTRSWFNILCLKRFYFMFAKAPPFWQFVFVSPMFSFLLQRKATKRFWNSFLPNYFFFSWLFFCST